jgi:hypothetical protein
MLISDETDDKAICREGLYVVLSESARTTRNYDFSAIHPNYVWPKKTDKNVKVLFTVMSTTGVSPDYVQPS